MHQFKVGLAIAKPRFSELEKFIKDESVDIFLFPEGFLHSDQLGEARCIVKKHQKWLVSGMDDRRIKGRKFETAVVINPKGEIAGEHTKTSLTKSERQRRYVRGNSIEIIKTKFCKLGISICYEIHFPEVARIYALKKAKIIFNPIGTGMWHEEQYSQWNAVAKTRASENQVFVLGCSHFNDQIPIAFAYAPDGVCLAQERNKNKLVKVVINFDQYSFHKHLRERRPELYKMIVR